MEYEPLHLGPLPRQMGGAHVVALGAGPFAQVAHVDGSPLEIGRGAFPEFLGRMCLSSMQWSITASNGTAQLRNTGKNNTRVWFPNGNRVDVAPEQTLRLLDGCYFGVRYWTNDSFVNEPRRALCTFWADRGSSYPLLDTEIYDTPPCM